MTRAHARLRDPVDHEGRPYVACATCAHLRHLTAHSFTSRKVDCCAHPTVMQRAAREPVVGVVIDYYPRKDSMAACRLHERAK